VARMEEMTELDAWVNNLHLPLRPLHCFPCSPRDWLPCTRATEAEGPPFFPQLLMKVLHGGHLTFLLSDTRGGRIKSVFREVSLSSGGKGPT
jgi:hypothetical protein